MTDVFSPRKRSEVMSRVGGKDTAPEMAVRRLVHRAGFRYSLHCRKLPGTPDLVLARLRKVIFVHGCFWHGHSGCRKGRQRPAANAEFWQKKIAGNARRDRSATRRLRADGWEILIIWECEVRDEQRLRARVVRFLSAGPSPGVLPEERGEGRHERTAQRRGGYKRVGPPRARTAGQLRVRHTVRS
ncbi:MAG TPA: very short patch repair endonuclease [Planctomycetes bacterium]|nr:very short patch repair endonuclease [Planctomycetota bacterium]